MAPKPDPLPPAVSCSQLTSLAAFHPQPAPVLTVNRPSPAVASMLALVADRLKFEAEPSCVTVLVSGVARLLPFKKIVPLRPPIQRSEERRVGKECRSRWS